MSLIFYLDSFLSRVMQLITKPVQALTQRDNFFVARALLKLGVTVSAFGLLTRVNLFSLFTIYILLTRMLPKLLWLIRVFENWAKDSAGDNSVFLLTEEQWHTYMQARVILAFAPIIFLTLEQLTFGLTVYNFFHAGAFLISVSTYEATNFEPKQPSRAKTALRRWGAKVRDFRPRLPAIAPRPTAT